MIRNNPNTFVCLDDIVDHPVDLNYVIYNPSKDNLAFRAELLYKTVKEGLDIELTSDQINHLIKYEVHQLNEFISDMRQIVDNVKRKR